MEISTFARSERVNSNELDGLLHASIAIFVPALEIHRNASEKNHHSPIMLEQ